MATAQSSGRQATATFISDGVSIKKTILKTDEDQPCVRRRIAPLASRQGYYYRMTWGLGDKVHDVRHKSIIN